jgi:glycerol-3-phosphate dehydrogenase
MSSRLPANISLDAFDVIVIGAGINGAGIARDAAMRGLKVLLIDKGDIGGGTSSWSTRLIHGGLRYLEYAEFGLVRESLRERETLLRIAPHLVRPLPLLLPIYDHSRRSLWTIRAGMIAYDLLSFDKSLSRHRILSRAAVLKVAPGLNAAGLRGAAVYHDAQVEFAERLVLENALAASEHGATIATYARVERLIIEQGTMRGVEFTDLKSNETRTARAAITINAAGPWVDQLASGLGFERMIGGTKGSHLVVAPFAGAPSTAIYAEAGSDHRPFFIIPWNDNYLIGTTDIRYDGDPDNAVIEDREIEYLLAETNRVIPDAKLTREAILFTYSGVRPLAFSKTRKEQRITRRHRIHDHVPYIKGFVSVVGGKLTTYRSLAAQAVDLVCKKLQLATPPCTTGAAPLPGAETPDFAAFCKHFKTESGLPAPASERLLRIYGTRAPRVLKLAAEDPALAARLSTVTSTIAAEVVYSFQHELAQTLSDCLLRRTMVGLSAAVGIGVDEVAASIGLHYLGWSETRVEQEVAAYRKQVEGFNPRSSRV